MIEGNLLIRASAGTGKTFSLATRYIRLMLLDGVAPERIVALTFSRAAAQEIYTKILDRLREAATDAAGAERERANLLAGFSEGKREAIALKRIDWSAANFARLLRRVIDAQHLGAIATLDSFILRIVRHFPLEMGFQNAVEVLDSSGEVDAVDKAMRDILNRATGTDTFVEAFRAARGGKMSRAIENVIGRMMTDEGWRAFILEHPECQSWTAQSMARALGLPDDPGVAYGEGLAIAPFLAGLGKSGADQALAQFGDYLASLKVGDNPFPSGSNRALEVARAIARHPRQPYVIHVKRTKEGPVEERYDYDQAVFDAGFKDLRRATDGFLRRQLDVVEAKLNLFAIIEKVYDETTRRAGKLTFKDFTDYSAASEASDRGLAIQNLEFRFDSVFDHWALDEFQDTSAVQWSCLRRLVESAAQPGDGRTVITVGDLKQSIYTWRGGDEGPFKEMMGWGAFREPNGRIEDVNTSHRYQKNICDFVNRVFGPENIRRGGILPSVRERAIERWLEANCWRDHEPERDKNGLPKANDAIKVIGVPPGNDPKENVVSLLLPVLARELKRVWAAHERVGSAETVGVLVRANEEGLTIAEYLRSEGLPVVWEGMNAVSDVPAVKAVVNLLSLAEHPEDSFAWRMVNDLLPVREILFPDLVTVEQVSERVAASLSQLGLTRTLKEYCGKLCEKEQALDALSIERLHALVRVGVDYERRSPKDYGVDGFVRFLEASSRRESGVSARVIRILTIHRSKGLTLDRVFVPISESGKSSIVETKSKVITYGKGGKWVLPHLSDDVALMNPVVRAVVETQRDERLLETLRTWYVALTRARKAMVVIQPLAPGKETMVLFRDLVAHAVKPFPRREEAGATVLYEQGAEPPFAGAKQVLANADKWEHTTGPAPIRRSSPSSAAHAVQGSGMPAAVLFGAGFGDAARYGVEVHARYQGIEWVDGTDTSGLPAAFLPAFMKPDPDATVWRERSYELLIGNRWETGQFDRVVFTGTGDARKAVIYDFKTSAKRSDETPEAFGERLCGTYRAQMRAYRAAIHALTGIPASNIRSVLLLTATGTAVDVSG